MPPKIGNKTPTKVGKSQPRISAFTRQLRSKHRSAPGSLPMPDIEEEEFETFKEPLTEEAGLKEVISKLNEIGRRVEGIEHALYNEDRGLKKRISEQELKVDTTHGKLLFVTKEYKAVKQDLGTLKGLMQKQVRQVDALDTKVTDIVARNMSLNMVISGIIESKDENCKFLAKQFLKEEMNLDLDMCPEFKIKVAHRAGYRGESKGKKKLSRPMIIRVNQSLKEAMMENIEQLNGRMNPQGDNYYVNIQQPEARVEARRNAKALLRKYQTKYATAKVEIRGTKVYVNNEWQRPLVRAPLPEDLYYDAEEQKIMNKLKIVYTQPQDSRHSTFWAAAARVDSVGEVQRVYNKIRQDAPSADHVAVAYVTKHEEEMVSGLVDDKEHGSGHKILKAIREAKEQSIAVFVARKFGGEHLRPARFEIISKIATKAILQLNTFIPTPRQPPSPPSGSPRQQQPLRQPEIEAGSDPGAAPSTD